MGHMTYIQMEHRERRTVSRCRRIVKSLLNSQKGFFCISPCWAHQSKIVAMAFAMAAEIERDLISQRTTEALAARKQQGMELGRPKGVGKSKLDKHQVEIIALLKNGATKTWIANKYGTTRRNLSHWMKQHDIV
jgi:DNA invertase Pin-like site-specific DNA recombinase